MRAFLLLLLSLGLLSLRAESILIAPAWKARNTPVITIDSILLRDTMSRLYITLKQIPHTTLTLHDDWVIQDSLGGLIGRVKDMDGADFNRIFQFDTDSIIAIEMDFPALPSSLHEFDLIGNKISGEMRVIGVSLTRQHQASTPSLPQFRTTSSPPIPVITFEPDSALLQGVLVGYHHRLGLPDGKIVLPDLFTGLQTTITVPIAADGSFAVRLPVTHPMQQKLVLCDRYIPFYIEPADTLFIQVSLDELFAPYRYIGEIEQNCLHLIYVGRNAQTNRDLRQIRLQNIGENEAWFKALNTLSPSQYRLFEENKFKVKLQQIKATLLDEEQTKKSYFLSILNSYYLYLSHLLVYNMINKTDTACEYEFIKLKEYPFDTIRALNNPFSTASEYYLDFISLLENKEATAPPPVWSCNEFMAALEERGIALSPVEKAALKFALGENSTPPSRLREIIQQLNERSEKEQISMREERLRNRRKEVYRRLLSNPDDFTFQLLETRRLFKLLQSLRQPLSTAEIEELTPSVQDPHLKRIIKTLQWNTRRRMRR
ncbi:hypothetical protein [Barnesiella sp. An55]|uniref:hypothetical protein n=1 Tax=Barnesiella sp. An55 TaxID=1965646 RepID=UPI000B382F7D|nr:hypothetical protein [Barnesiella sp. An55]OUN74734.1 hypothetical protein B5G10_00455 [Barnesiella sp. An55]